MKFLILNIFIILFTISAVSQPVPWSFTPTTISHNVNIGTAAITVDNIPVEAGDAIGLFYDSLGDLACGGYSIWPATQIIAYGDDSGEPNGFALDEAFKFKIWKKKDNCIIDSGSIVQFEYLPPTFNDSIFFKLNGTSKMITLNGAKKEIYYPNTFYCQGDPDPLPIKVGSVPDVVYSSQPGLVINSATGQINIAASLPGTYTIFFNTSFCLISNSFRIKIKLNVDDLGIAITPPSCTENGSLEIDESAILCGISPYEYKLKNILNGEEISYTINTLNEVPEGNYELFVKDASGTEVKFKDIITLTRECKDLIIAPYSSGQMSSYFIPFEGMAKVYDRFGLLKKEMSIPADWDATDNTGNLLPAGQYIIICNEDKQIVVTVIK